jgi:hypothetical protein
MIVEVSDQDCFCDVVNAPYEAEVPNDASLQEIWDIVCNGGEKSDEIINAHWGISRAEEGQIYFDDSNESSAGHIVEITWQARPPGTYKTDQINDDAAY